MFDTVAASRLNRRPAPKYRGVLDQAQGAGGGLSNFAWTAGRDRAAIRRCIDVILARVGDDVFRVDRYRLPY
jgi:hypothetical protein